MNNKKRRVAWWLNFIGYIFFAWLIWDLFHISEYIFISWRMNFGIFKFFAAIVFIAAANIVMQGKSN